MFVSTVSIHWYSEVRAELFYFVFLRSQNQGYNLDLLKYQMQRTVSAFIIKLSSFLSIDLRLIRRTKDNIIASVVDVASIVFAYKLGVSQLGLGAGLGYGVFDAWIVIWQRERIANGLRSVSERIRTLPSFRRKDALPWAMD